MTDGPTKVSLMQVVRNTPQMLHAYERVAHFKRTVDEAASQRSVDAMLIVLLMGLTTCANAELPVPTEPADL